MKLNIAELDCIFISYDEPNAENNWTDLLQKCLWAKRVHGVKGSDECHKAAANLSETEWFVTVDADNIVDYSFFDQAIDIPEGAKALSWPGVNIINGLRYGNGSLKVWRKDFVLTMRSHEANGDSVDFCWENGYRPMVESFSVTYPNASSFQAWRAGFREGVKMSLIDGVKRATSIDQIHWHNIHRLKIWCSVGSHVDNGLWAILGARQGAYMTICTDWNWVDVRDFDKLYNIWSNTSLLNVKDEIFQYGNMLNSKLEFEVTLLEPSISEFVVNTFRDQYQQSLEQALWTLKRNV